MTPTDMIHDADECSFDPETWTYWEGVDGPVIVCNMHGQKAPCEMPEGFDAYNPRRPVVHGTRWA